MLPTLRLTSYSAALFIAIVLGALLLLGSRQYNAQKSFETVIEQNEKIIFQFATIREHISESLLEGKFQQLTGITSQIEELNANLSQILQEPFIPDEYKLSFMGQVDMAGISLLLRGIASEDIKLPKIRELNQEIRVLGDRLMLFDRVIVNHAKRKLVSFQSIIIGILALVLFVITYILVFWHYQIAVPMFDLINQLKEIRLGKRDSLIRRRKSGELAQLTESIQHLFLNQKKSNADLERMKQLLAITGRIAAIAKEAENREVMLAGICKELLALDDYCLTWVGVPENGNGVRPLFADGSTTMSGREREECMDALLTAAATNNHENDAALQALTSRRSVVQENILAELPMGPFKNTPFAAGYANCIAVPLISDDLVYGVITIYSAAQISFSDIEVELLAKMGSIVALITKDKETRRNNYYLTQLNTTLKGTFDHCSDLVLITDGGAILHANQAAENILGKKNHELAGTNILDILYHEQESPPQPLVDALNAGSTAQDIKLVLTENEYKATLIPLPGLDRCSGMIFIACEDLTRSSYRTDTIRASKLAALGELAVGVAHEINNLSNALINYGQILSDELTEFDGDNTNYQAILSNIINEGESIAHIVQQLLNFSNARSYLSESVQIEKVIDTSLALISHQLQQDGILTVTEFPKDLPPTRMNVQKMQHVFLNLLSNARYALNLSYSGQHPNKRLEIKGETLSVNGQKWLRIIVIDHGKGIDPDIADKIFDPFFTTKPDGEGTGLGLSISKGLIEDNGGTIHVESQPEEYTKISIEFPVL